MQSSAMVLGISLDDEVIVSRLVYWRTPFAMGCFAGAEMIADRPESPPAQPGK
jgi:hypothetical protein